MPQHSSVCFMENLMSSCYQMSLFACEFEWRRCQKWEHKSHCHCWWEYDRAHIRNVCQRSTVFSSAESMWMLLLLNRGCKRARVVGCTLSKLRGSRRFNLIKFFSLGQRESSTLLRATDVPSCWMDSSLGSLCSL